MGRFSFNRRHIGAQLLLRSWPFMHGSGRLADRLFSHVSLGGEQLSVVTSDGFSIRVQPSDLMGRHLYLTGAFDRSIFVVLHDFSQPGDTLFDIGANIGYVSACFLWNIPGSFVIAVDPQPGIVELLRHNLNTFDSTRHRLFPVAVSDKDGTGLMEICVDNPGASRLVDSSNESTVQITTWSFARLIAEAKTEKIDLIKIDVEGNEANIISAMAPVLDRIHPRAIVFEEHGTMSAPDGLIGSILGNAGYRVFGIRKKLWKLDLVSIRNARDCTTNDYIAVRASTPLPNSALRKYPALRNLG